MKPSCNPVLMPALIEGPMPNGDALDPPVDQIALDAARLIESKSRETQPKLRVTMMQIAIAAAINRALDRCQELGGRRRV